MRYEPDGDRFEIRPTLETEIRRIVREEIANALKSFEEVAESEGHSSEDTIKVDALYAVALVAERTAARLRCSHPNVFAGYSGDRRCRDCGQPIES